MKRIENVRFVYMNKEEIMKTLKRLDGNRCNANNVDEAIKQGFTERDYKRFLRRQKLIKKGFEKLGCWDISSPLRLGKCNNEYYVIDGQGRLATWMKLEKEYLSKGKGHFQKEIPVQIDERNMTMKELEEMTKVLNTTGTKWNMVEMMHSQAVYNKEAKYVYDLFTKIREQDTLIKDEGIKLFLVGRYRSKLDELVKKNIICKNKPTILYDMYKDIADACKANHWDDKEMLAFYRFLTTNAIFLYYVKTGIYTGDKEESNDLRQKVQKRLLKVIPSLPISQIDRIFTGNYKTVIQSLNKYLMKGLRKDNPLIGYFKYVDNDSE